MTNVEELKGLLERATKGPWRYDDGKILTPGNERLRVSGTSQPSGYVPDEDESYANAELIVAAVNALPALLEERERLRESCRRARILFEAISLIISLSPECDAMWQRTKLDLGQEVVKLQEWERTP